MQGGRKLLTQSTKFCVVDYVIFFCSNKKRVKMPLNIIFRSLWDLTFAAVFSHRVSPMVA